MQILDPGHIYRISPVRINRYTYTNGQYLRFVKRSGGAVTYQKEWPGIQTQAVMRAVINFLHVLASGDLEEEDQVFPLWQLGADDFQYLRLTGINDLRDVLTILDDRSRYLNNILPCNETMDACSWLLMAKTDLVEPDFNWNERIESAIYSVRQSLWCYEARAYRRKQESVNRKHPTHDDTERLRSWRDLPAADVPFNYIDIEDRPIGPDGHIVLE